MQTQTEEDASERKVTATLKSFSGEALSRERVEKSVQLAPTVATPERQAQWLIHTYIELDLVGDLPIFFDPKDYRSYDLRTAIETLNERGVNLSAQQQAAAIDGDAALYERKLNRPNAPMLFEGDITIEGGQEHFVVSFETGGGAHVIARGTGAMAMLDDNLHVCSRKPDGCKFKSNILAIVWRCSRKGDNVNLDMIPLALW